jgi:nucleoside phosphorylase
MIIVAFPTEYEAQDLIKQLESKEKRVLDGVTCFAGYISSRPVFIPILGIGPEAASASTKIVLRRIEPKIFILAGYAGGITSEVTRGQILIARDYSSQNIINYLKLVPGFDIGSVHPVNDVVVSAAEKKRLGEETGCQMVDMETAYVSNLVAEAGIEFLGIRAISDLVDEDVPNDVLECGYDQVHSRTTPVKLLGFLVLHPKRIQPLKDFLKPLPAVRRKLTDFLVTIIGEF